MHDAVSWRRCSSEPCCCTTPPPLRTPGAGTIPPACRPSFCTTRVHTGSRARRQAEPRTLSIATRVTRSGLNSARPPTRSISERAGSRARGFRSGPHSRPASRSHLCPRASCCLIRFRSGSRATCAPAFVRRNQQRGEQMTSRTFVHAAAAVAAARISFSSARPRWGSHSKPARSRSCAGWSRAFRTSSIPPAALLPRRHSESRASRNLRRRLDRGVSWGLRACVTTACALWMATSVSAQTPPGQELRDEIERLRKEFDALRQQYDNRMIALETRLAALEDPPAAGAPPASQPGAGDPPAVTGRPTEIQVPPGAEGAGGPTGALPVYGNTSAAVQGLQSPTSPSSATCSALRAAIRSRTARPSQLSEAEASFQAIVDPYAKADFFIAVGPEGAELEEGFITFNTLPGRFLLKAGKMRAAFGKVNTQHSHVLAWTDRPLVSRNLVGGEEGLGDAGLSLSRLVLNPWFFLEATGGVFPAGAPSCSRGTSARTSPTSVACAAIAISPKAATWISAHPSPTATPQPGPTPPRG